ncbi:MAG: RNA 2'-phosphotransferase [Planctomycetota bacterium]
MSDNLTRIGKFLSLVLRHRPEAIGLQLDSQGWVPVDQLIRHANDRGRQLSLEVVLEVVAKNEKKRFALSEDGLMIRANQGHSIAHVDLGLASQPPPQILFHGTVATFLDSIREHGLKKRSRNHVHLSVDSVTATRVGARRGKPILLTVQSRAMHDAGHLFYLSDNGVWLTEHVPPAFLIFPG